MHTPTHITPHITHATHAHHTHTSHTHHTHAHVHDVVGVLDFYIDSAALSMGERA